MWNFHDPGPNTTIAYHQDASGDEYFGKAPKGKKTSQAVWQIFKMEHTTDKDWIIYYPVDAGKASDQPKFIWDSVETYTYRELGT